MPTINDTEFGEITIRRSAAATQIKIRASANGTLQASVPTGAPLFLVKRLLKNSRDEIRKIINQSKPEYSFKNGTRIGKSHTLIIQSTDNLSPSVSRHGQQIIIKSPNGSEAFDAGTTRKIRDLIIAALRDEAKSYLPRRLAYLADKFSFCYGKTRFSHSSGRWGSCSSTGTISLNIALMKLPFELIDYVIIHELSHTKQMNHSSKFWDLVYSADPNYKLHRKTLKSYNPTI